MGVVPYCQTGFSGTLQIDWINPMRKCSVCYIKAQTVGVKISFYISFSVLSYFPQSFLVCKDGIFQSLFLLAHMCSLSTLCLGFVLTNSLFYNMACYQQLWFWPNVKFQLSSHCQYLNFGDHFNVLNTIQWNIESFTGVLDLFGFAN